MNKNLFIAADGREIHLTDDEVKVIRAFKRLEKMNFGRLVFFAQNGDGSIRVTDNKNGFYGNKADVVSGCSIRCDGGDSD